MVGTWTVGTRMVGTFNVTFTLGVGTFTLGAETFTLGVGTFTLGVETFTLGIEIFTLGVETFTLGIETFTLGVETFTLGVETLGFTRGVEILTALLGMLARAANAATVARSTLPPKCLKSDRMRPSS